MSTVKSSAENLTLNADGSGNDIKFQSNAVEKGSLTDGGVWIGSTFEPTGDTAASDNAAIGYTAAEGLILTGQGSTDDVTIKNDADTTVLNVATGSSDIEVSAGDLIFGTAGKGVCLGVTTNTDANTLDDYEEGTFTPVLTSSGTDWSSPAPVLLGGYVKVGKMVNINITVDTNAYAGGTKTNALTITGLPFTPDNSYMAVWGLAPVKEWWIDYPNGLGGEIRYSINGTNTYVQMHQMKDNTGSTELTAVAFDYDDTRLCLQGHYYVA